jgi:peptide chain release factor 3
MTVSNPADVRQSADARKEAARRRTFAVISHPDAGKSTLTEAITLHARAITQAGAVHGKAGRSATVSDWMEMEKARGISISSSALQFPYRDAIINIVDTPGHADFSEDTYRVLSAVDCAVMLIDAAKGMEPQTRKLFAVCKQRGLPIITIINKWDRPGQEALTLLDEVANRTGMTPTPLTWPVGIAGHFRGVLDRRDGNFVRFTRTAGGATIAPEEVIDPERAAQEEGSAWEAAVEEHGILASEGWQHDQANFLAGKTTPVLFTSAVLNFGVSQLLDVLYELAPSPSARLDINEKPREIDAPFSAQVFKVQAGMDRAHRDRLAFARVCSGIFYRGDVIIHEPTGRGFATKYAHTVFGREREVVDIAYPGDVVGLVNAGNLRAGDTLYADKKVTFPPLPLFAPEHFAVIRAKDPSRYKQFRKGIEQLDHEGVVQVLRSDRRGDQAPVLAAVGPMQFEVATHRLESEFSTPITLERLDYTLARRTISADLPKLAMHSGVEVMERSDGVLLALVKSSWQLRRLEQEIKGVTLEPLVADAD